MRATVFACLFLALVLCANAIDHAKITTRALKKAKLSRHARNSLAKQYIDEDIRRANRFRQEQEAGLHKEDAKEQSITLGSSQCTTMNAFTALNAARASEAVKTKVRAFSARGGDCVWKDVLRADVGRVLLERLENPHTVNQRDAGFCAPSCFLFWLAVRKPALYADFTMAMCDSGKFTAPGDYEVEASEDLRNYGKGNSNFKNMAHADWIDMAALREKENDFMDVHADASDRALGGDVFAGDVEDWFEAFFPEKETNEHSSRMWGEKDALLAANNAVTHGGSACLIVDARIVQGGAMRENGGQANHWVAFTGGFSENTATKMLTFNIWTWATQCPITIHEDDFEDVMFASMTNGEVE
jgi:hypothetical protein